MRSTREVLESHLAHRKAGDLEADLAENYQDDVALVSWGEGTGRGKDEIRRRAEVLSSYLGEGAFAYEEVLVEGEVGMLRWTGRAPEVAVRDGVDSFVVRDGLIVAQTIYYSVQETGSGRHRG
ncbi:nuclear transport factor 2 family protein [Georgenia subflava]|uniref:Nuclear transport factor 2 family protein n=1 Tax=Georgenia subflava TaxID=1622177 RepID=A0A6N7EG32_9MICO|nr:nuclear transport factor 2 family protein [Georgenia subflava]MPV36990.1 nuclear transport factor 2 family protein [Georgenia subflava]